jgi:hypothetical protein
MSGQGAGSHLNWDPQPSQRSKAARPVKTKTRVRASALSLNHNEALVADRPRRLCRR